MRIEFDLPYRNEVVDDGEGWYRPADPALPVVTISLSHFAEMVGSQPPDGTELEVLSFDIPRVCCRVALTSSDAFIAAIRREIDALSIPGIRAKWDRAEAIESAGLAAARAARTAGETDVARLDEIDRLAREVERRVVPV